MPSERALELSCLVTVLRLPGNPGDVGGPFARALIQKQRLWHESPLSISLSLCLSISTSRLVMSSAQLEHMAHPPLPPNGGPSAGVITKSSLRYRKRSVCVAVFYLLLLVIPWVVTCVMMFRPVGKPSYNSLAGTQAYKHGEGLDGTTAYTEGDAQDMQRWVQAAHVMNTIATVLALPVLSSLLAQAAVRYTQRQSNGKALNLGQLFSLADRGWADISLVVKTVSSPRTASPLLLFGALLSLVGELATFGQLSALLSSCVGY